MNRIPVSGLITPISPNDEYPIIDPQFGIDGLRNLSTLQEMFNIPLDKRRAGMVVGIPNSSNNTVAYYKLKPQGNGLTWSVGTSSDWDGFLSSATSSALAVKYLITNETIEVPTNYHYLVYGNLTIGTNGHLKNYGRTVILNGDLILQDGGTMSNFNDFRIITLTREFKYASTFSAVPGVGITISHNLNTQDITYTLREGNNFIQGNVELDSSDPANKVIVTLGSTISVVRINIIG